MFSVAQAEAWVRSTAAVIEEHAAALTKLDSAIGDGDHGTNMNRGFKAAVQRLDGLEGDQDFGSVFKGIGMALQHAAKLVADPAAERRARAAFARLLADASAPLQ